MKLAAIYNVWDGVELLSGSMKSVADGVDLFIIVFQKVSNTGEIFDPTPWIHTVNHKQMLLIEYRPDIGLINNPGQHERNKRNLGLNIAREHGCSHFLHMDCDEYYMDFTGLVNKFKSRNITTSVCNIHSYFKSPTLRLENLDNYYVPFIHVLDEHTTAGKVSQKNYGMYVDPTRTINTGDFPGIIGTMHHFTWIRNEIERKVRNSTAVNNIMRSNLLDDYNSPFTNAGSILKDYNNQKLIRVPDHFEIKKMLDPDNPAQLID